MLQSLIGGCGQILREAEGNNPVGSSCNRAFYEAGMGAQTQTDILKRAFNCGTAGFTVPLGGVAVADREKPSFMEAGKVHNRPGAKQPAVKIAAVICGNVSARTSTLGGYGQNAGKGRDRNPQSTGTRAEAVLDIPDLEIFFAGIPQAVQMILISDADRAPAPVGCLNYADLNPQSHPRKQTADINRPTQRLPVVQTRTARKEWRVMGDRVGAGNAPIRLQSFYVKKVAGVDHKSRCMLCT